MATHTPAPAAPEPIHANNPQPPTTMTERLKAAGYKVYDRSTLGQAFQEAFQEAKAAREAKEATAPQQEQ